MAVFFAEFCACRNRPAKQRRAGQLTARVIQDRVVIEFTPSTTYTDTLSVHIALLGFGLTTEIRAGENNGRVLSHDFVVLDLKRKTLRGEAGKYLAVSPRPRSRIAAERYAIALWVTSGNGQTPLQAVGGWIR